MAYAIRSSHIYGRTEHQRVSILIWAITIVVAFLCTIFAFYAGERTMQSHLAASQVSGGATAVIPEVPNTGVDESASASARHFSDPSYGAVPKAPMLLGE